MDIIGKSECTANQMAEYLIRKNSSAKSWALEYAQIYLEEGEEEGVRGDGAWIQSCKETGNFKFTGGTAVTFGQNNFCGLGVTKKGMKGNSFATPRLGIRAQIQHLKGYATSLPLKNACVDPRYKYIIPKGKAPRFEDLAGKWAVPGYDTSKAYNLQDAMNKKIGYGFDVISGINEMKNIKVSDITDNTIKGANKMKINIHAGHNPEGKVACGAIGILNESREDRIVKDKVITMLKAQGHTVYDCTVDNGTNQNDVLNKIVTKCNANTVDLDISIHFNSNANDKNGNGITTGTEVFVYSSTSQAKKYAQNIVNAIAALGFKNRGVKYSTSLYVLKKTKSPALLIECCFVDDKDDAKLYNADKMAQAIVKGITGVTTNIPTTSTSSPNHITKYTYQGIDYSIVFDPTYYANKYADLKNVYGTNATNLFNHFCTFGMKEGRQASANFSVFKYKEYYADLRNAFGNNLPLYYQHYVTNGYKENRKCV